MKTEIIYLAPDVNNITLRTTSLLCESNVSDMKYQQGLWEEETI